MRQITIRFIVMGMTLGLLAGPSSCGCETEVPPGDGDAGVEDAGPESGVTVDGGDQDAMVGDVFGIDLSAPDVADFDRMVDQPDPDDPDNVNKDSDCDGLSDLEEYGNVYASGGQTLPGDADSDGDGLLDGQEVGRVSSPDTRCGHYIGDAAPASQTDPTNPDTDGDGLLDGVEDANHDGAYAYGQETDPRNPDTDGDGLCDGPNDVPPLCTGGDPAPLSPIVDRDGDGVTDANDADPDDPDRDDDGLCDGPGDVPGVCSGGEDLNGDGLVGGNETDPDMVDTDCDGVSDGDEVTAGLNPRRADTDGDLLPDGLELGVTQSLDPTGCPGTVVDLDPGTTTDPASRDTDGDGINDGIEDANRNGRFDATETNPEDPDTDDDGLCDGPNDVAGVCTAGEDLNANGVFDFGETDPRVDDSTTTGPNPDDPNNAFKDSDCDGLSDGEEFGNVYAGGGQTDPANPDSDGDGLPDGLEAGRTTSPDVTCLLFVPDADPSQQTDPTRADTDGDGVVDGDEDTNHDGAYTTGELNPRDPDTDNDGLCDGPNDVLPLCTGGDPDPYESIDDRDFDGVPDVNDTAPDNPDRDGDGLCDGGRDVSGTCVSGEDLNGDGVVGAGETDPDRVDTDCDGVSDAEERQLGLNPRRADTDGDLVPDGVELGRITNLDPTNCPGFVGDANPATTTDPLSRDSDGDGINDGIEDANRDGAVDGTETDPSDADTDDDGLCDGPQRVIAGVCTGGEDINANGQVDPGETDPRVAGTAPTDADSDGLGDDVENGSACLDSADPDSDDDGLCDGSTTIAGTCDAGEDININGRIDPGETDPCSPDSDCDGVSDGDERAASLNPLDPDTDGDGLTDGVELGAQTDLDPTNCAAFFIPDADGVADTNPLVSDSDGDGVLDGAEDSNQNGRVDCADGSFPPSGDLADCPGGETELDPNNGSDISGTVTNACAQPLAPELHGQLSTDLLMATSQAFPGASTTTITDGAGETVGIAFVDATNQLTGFALRKAPEGADPAAEMSTIQQRIGNITVPLEQSFTTWDGFDAARGTYTFGNGENITNRTQRAVRQALNDGAATVTLTGAPSVGGPFKLGLEVVRRSATTTVVVGVLQELGAYNTSGYRHEDVQNGSGLAQVGDEIGLQCDRFDSAANQVVDFIWVIDDSGSMDDAQDAVAAAGDEMIAQLNNSTLDWRIAIVTTYYTELERDLWDNDDGTYCNFQTTSANFLRCLNNVQAASRGTERGFQSLEEALDNSRFLPATTGAAQAGKVRADARVVAIFLSDAGDQSNPQDIPEWTTFFQGGNGSPSWDTNRTDEEAMILGGIICPRGVECSGEGDSTGPGDQEQEQYYQVIQNLGGVTGSIAQADGSGSATNADIQATIQGIMNTVIGLATPYVLTKAPISATIKVAMEGPVTNPGGCNAANVPRSRQDGFSYDGASRALAFHGDCRPATVGTEIATSYYFWTDWTDEPDGPGDECDCDPPEVCDPVTLLCYCPPDCGVGTVPPQQVCDATSCTLTCRQDCGGLCTGASSCDATPGVCDCICPPDCGGAAPGPGYTCDRVPGSPTFCQWTCDSCAGSPSNPDMVCDPLTCTWACPDCGSCPGLSSCSEITCQCECQQSMSCSPGFDWSDTACDCVCDTGALGCVDPYVADAGLCACVCAADCGGACGATEVCNPSVCECQCPPDCGMGGAVPPEQVCDTSTCELVCRPDCGGTCTGNSVCDTTPGVCACDCPTDCGGTSPGANFTCDRTEGSPSYCQWVCEACPGTAPNALMVCDFGTCEWTCPDCGDCPGLATCSDSTCQCECSESITCNPGYAWDQAACDCACDVEALPCSDRQVPNAGLCACVCGPDCNEVCEFGTRCNESLCQCIPEGG